MADQSEAAPLRLALLGRFELSWGDRIVIDRSWNRSRAKALLKLLALQPRRALHREQVIDILWPDLDPAAGANNLYKNLHYLRSRLVESGVPGPLIATTDDLLTIPQAVQVDIDAFREAAAAASRTEDLKIHEAAISLYGGELLPEDLYEEWTEPLREELRTVYLHLLAKTAARYEQAYQLQEAAEVLQRLLPVDPLQETAHAALIRLYARMGSRHRARRQYQVCRDLLRSELDVSPSAETERIYQEVLSGLHDPSPRGPGLFTPAPQRTRAPGFSIFGRDQELERVADLLEQAAEGSGSALFINGTAGIGKSLVVQQAVQMARDVGGAGLVGRSFEMEATIPYHALRELLRETMEGILGTETRDYLRESLYLKRVTPGAGIEQMPLADAGELQAELFNEVAEFLRLASRSRRPVLLAFDDLHNADEATVRLVHFLCREVVRYPVLLLATYRVEEATPDRPLGRLLASLRRLRGITELHLAPLPEHVLQLVVGDALGTEPVDRGVLEELARKAEGNPLFARELVHSMLEDGTLRLIDGCWQRRDRGPLAVPTAVQDLFLARLERLGEGEQFVLRAASVIGREFTYALLREMAPFPETRVLDALDRCITAYMIEETPAGYRFLHELTWEVVYRSLTRARRQQLHRQAATVLSGVQHDQAPEVAERIGYHFQQSDEPWRAVPYLRAAGSYAASVFANEEATRLYDSALAIARAHPGRVEKPLLAHLKEDRADIVRRTGDVEISTEAYTEAVTLYQEASDQEGVFRARGKAALGAIVQGRFDEASDLLEQTLSGMNEQSPQIVVARTYYLLAQLRWHNSEHRGALEAAEKALLSADTAGDPSQKAKAFEVLALACHSLGDWQKGVVYELSRHELGEPGFDTDEAFEAHL